MSWRLARSLATLRRQVNDAAPHRSKVSDGTIGDAAHSSRYSDHNPDPSGVVRAFDCTHDPANGMDAHALADRLLAEQDPRLSYVISRRRIGSGPAGPSPGRWRPYSGSNPHDKHAHVSVVADSRADQDHPWAQVVDRRNEPADRDRPPPPPKITKGDDMDLLPVLRLGSSGQAVRNLQGLLVAAGRKVAVDGDFGPGTKTVLAQWQAAARAPGGADGVCGPGTWGRLLGLR